MADVSELMAERAAWVQDHLNRYLEDGEKGHLLDMSDLGASPLTTTLILKTIGRHTGRVILIPLIYRKVGEEYVIIASKGGADEHPSWFLNLTTRADVSFQVAKDCFCGSWRIVEGSERQEVWDIMASYFPPYAEYQAVTMRQIPVVLLRPTERIAEL